MIEQGVFIGKTRIERPNRGMRHTDDFRHGDILKTALAKKPFGGVDDSGEGVAAALLERGLELDIRIGSSSTRRLPLTTFVPRNDVPKEGSERMTKCTSPSASL